MWPSEGKGDHICHGHSDVYFIYRLITTKASKQKAQLNISYCPDI